MTNFDYLKNEEKFSELTGQAQVIEKLKPLGEFVREIVGLDMRTAKEAFAKFLNDENLDSSSVADLFTEDMGKWNEIREIIEDINGNALV